MTKRQKDFLCGLSSIFLYLFLSSISTTILSLLNIDYSGWSATLKTLFNIGYDLIIIFIIFLLFRKTIIANIKDYWKQPLAYLAKYIKYWFLTLALMYVSNICISLIGGEIAKNQQAVLELVEMSPILMFILSGIIAPILEELVFRLSIRKVCGSNKYFFIIISGIIFGGMHIIGSATNWMDWLYIIPYGIPGCIFAYTLTKSDNICVPISLHMIHNCFALILQFIAMM